jgi:hypothetical protein
MARPKRIVIPIGVSTFLEVSGSRKVVDLHYPSRMDVSRMISDLRQEREQLGEAIIALERLAQGHGKRRGRPPAWMSAQKSAPKRRGRPPGSKNKN